MSQREPWAAHGEPFCWQPKAALRKIRQCLDSEGTVSSAILVYAMLTELASDKEAAEFQSTYAYLAMRAGLSVRTVQARTKDLVALGLVQFVVPQLKSPGTFRLVPVKQWLPNDAQPLHDDRHRSVFAPLPALEESHIKNCTLEETLEEREGMQGKGGAGKPSPACHPPITPALRAFAPKLQTGRFSEAWDKWVHWRMVNFRQPKGGWARLFSEQMTFLEQYNEPEAVEILNHSLRNGYQGLFRPCNAPRPAPAPPKQKDWKDMTPAERIREVL